MKHDSRFNLLDVPMFFMPNAARTTRPFPCLPPQILLQDEIDAIPDYESRVRETVAHYPPAYSSHPVVRRAAACGEVVTPLALYIDGVGFTRRESIVGIYVINMITGVRHLCCSIKKHDICMCGCRGWCSYYVIFLWLEYCFAVLSDGVHATSRYDKTDFRPEEGRLRSLSGTPCKKAAVVWVKADLMEFGSTLGFPTTASKENHVSYATAVLPTSLRMKVGMFFHYPGRKNLGAVSEVM